MPNFNGDQNGQSDICIIFSKSARNQFVHSGVKFNRIFPQSIKPTGSKIFPSQWRHSERDIVSNHQPHDYLLNRLFRRRSKKISKLRITGLCDGNSPVTGEFPAQKANNAENVSIWWRHHALCLKSSVVVQQPTRWHTQAVYSWFW